MGLFQDLKAVIAEKGFVAAAAAMFILVFMATYTYAWAQKEVSVQVDGKTIEVKSFAADVAGALTKAGVTLGEKDRVEPALDTALEDGLEIEVYRSFAVEIVADGKVVQVDVPPVATGEALRLAGISLGPMDRVEPALDSLLQGPGQVKVIRVKEETITRDQEIPYAVEKTDDEKLERGIRRIVQRGKNGLDRQVIKVTYEDGKVAKQEVLESKTVRKPVNQVVAMGTISVASRGGQSFRFKEAIEMTSTAYTHTGRNTASGIYPTVGSVAVDPSVIPMGSRVYVEGYGFATAMDTGGAIKGNKIDVFMETLEECRRWGRRTVKVYVLE